MRGERRDERVGERGRRELRYGAFERAFVLPEHLGPESVSAIYDAGMLNIRIADSEPHRIAISTGGRPAVEGKAG